MRQYERTQRGWGTYGSWPWGWHAGWNWFWPAALIVIGVYSLLSNLGLLTWLKGDILWPSLLILLGVLLLLRRGRW